jgi:uncharacterized protein with PIN domain
MNKPADLEAQRACEFRFYEELNDFLAPALRKTSFQHRFTGTPSVKDRIESLGVPHTEVDLILVDGVSVGFDHLLQGGERVAVYPMFERFDIAGLTRLRPEPLRRPAFILDVHLGRLARYLRLLGFDTAYRHTDLGDPEIARLGREQHRIVLTRDVGLLKRALVTHGAFLHHTAPRKQVEEVLRRFDLWRLVRLFSRCSHCNGPLQPIARADVAGRVPPRVWEYQRVFYRCADCEHLYWAGTHGERVRDWLEPLLGRHGIVWPDFDQSETERP